MSKEKIDTEMLNIRLEKCETDEDFEKFEKSHKKYSFQDCLYKMCNKYDVEICDLQNEYPFSKTHFHEVKNMQKKISRDKTLSLALSLRELNSNVTKDDINELLKSAGHKELYPYFEEDHCIIYGLNTGKNIYEIQQMLDKRRIKMKLLPR